MNEININIWNDRIELIQIRQIESNFLRCGALIYFILPPTEPYGMLVLKPL